MTIINWSTEYSIILVNFLGQEREENKYKTNKQTKKKEKRKKGLCHFRIGGRPVYNRIEINHSSLVDFEICHLTTLTWKIEHGVKTC